MLQTQVVDLLEEQSVSPNISNNETIKPIIISASTDEEDFTVQLAQAVDQKGWLAEEVEDNSFILTSPHYGIYIIEYIYESSWISRVMIYSVWVGLGESNLSPEVLSDINRINDEQYLAKVSVDPYGDIWLETVYAFEYELEVESFLRYVEWFEDTEPLLVMGDLSPYIAEDESIKSGEV